LAGLGNHNTSAFYFLMLLIWQKSSFLYKKPSISIPAQDNSSIVAKGVPTTDGANVDKAVHPIDSPDRKRLLGASHLKVASFSLNRWL
jgi:hypothetical protein